MEIALLHRIIFIIFAIMGFYLMKWGSNWERKVPHKHMVIQIFKNSIQKSGLVRDVRATHNLLGRVKKPL